MESIKLCLLFVVIIGGMVSTIDAHIANFDAEWQRRAQQSKEAARKEHHPNPGAVASQLNRNVHLAVEGKARTRRGLRTYDGPCMATNPIDQCWRCDKNWAQNRQKLADCVQGFGKNTTGGKGGKIYIVTNGTDTDLLNPLPGTLRHAVIQPEPLWIIFDHDMTIKLQQELIMTGDKTIDGRGVQLHIAYGAGLMLQFVKNIIIHSVKIHDTIPGEGGIIRDSTTHYGQRTRSDGDGISIFGSQNIWIDHISMWNCSDGLVDVIQGSTGITLSNCHFTRHNDVLLFGASNDYEEDKLMQVTVAFNHFGKGLIQRMPRVRYGFVHVVNNDYTHWLMYAIGGSQNPTILSQGNRFVAPPDPNVKQITKRDGAPESEWKKWVWKSENDLFQNGAFFVQSGDPKFAFPDDMVAPKPGSLVGELTRFAGGMNCVEGTPC